MEEEIILNKIIEEAETEAEKIINEAKEQAKAMEEEANSKIAKMTQEQFEIIQKRIEKEMTSQLEKAEFDARSAELIERKKLIEIVKEKVKQKINDLDEKTYVNLINEKISKYKNQKDVELLLPKKCYEELKKIGNSYGMKVLDVTDEFDSGVIIKCGKIEYNYDFEENMKFMDEEIEKEIDTILFN